LSDGPVRVVATTPGQKILVSERQIYLNSFTESMGIPANELTNDYWFPWYDGVNMRTWITIGAASTNTEDASVDIYIGGDYKETLSIEPSGQETPSYPGLSDGPVRVVTTTLGQKIMVSERQIYGDSFAESMGVPADQVTNDYWFPWYDGLNMRTWVTIGAPSTNTEEASVEVYVAGALKGTYPIAPAGQETPSYPGISNGPVRVVTTTPGQKILVSERQIYGGGFAESMGVPAGELTNEYWFPWYDGLNMRTWITIGSP
jgi:hypothetical protein